MNFLKASSKLSRTSYVSFRAFASSQSNCRTTDLFGVPRNTNSDAGTGLPPSEAYKSLREHITRGASGGGRQGESITNRNTILDTAQGQVSPHERTPGEEH